jgi:hypothetical protein
MRHAQGFTQSHWMPPLGKYWLRITPVDAMVINLLMPYKTQLLAITFGRKPIGYFD